MGISSNKQRDYKPIRKKTYRAHVSQHDNGVKVMNYTKNSIHTGHVNIILKIILQPFKDNPKFLHDNETRTKR